MIFTSFFTTSGAPATGLSPTITIRKVSDGSAVVSAQAMTEVGSGWYKYDYTGYDETLDYVFMADGGAGQPAGERYVFGATDGAGTMTQVLTDTAEVQAELANGGRTDLLIDSILGDTNELQTDWVNGGRLDLLVDGIKAKTDNLPASPANETTLTTIDGIVDSILADTGELQTDWTNGGRLDLLVDAIKAKTDNLPASPAATGAAMTLTAAYDAAKTAATQTSVDTIDGIVDSILADTNELQTELVEGGRTDLILDGIAAKTVNLPASPAAVGSEMTLTSAYDAAKTTAQAGDAMTLTGAYDAAKSAASQASVNTVDGIVDSILADTNELQTNQGNWLTATGFAVPGDQMDLVNAPNAIAITAIQAGMATSAEITALNDVSVGDLTGAIVEGSLTILQVFRILLAVLAGKSAGGGGTTIVFRDVADAKDRIMATVDSNGNRTEITLDAS